VPAGTPTPRIATSLVGMANGRGGTLLIGVSPRSNRVHGVPDPEKEAERVLEAALLAEPPIVLPFPEAVDFDGSTLILVHVPQGLPHVYALAGRYWQRDGPVTGPLSAKKLRHLLIERGEASYESERPEGASLEDLDPTEVQAYLAAIGASQASDPWQILQSRGCLAPWEGSPRPTAAGLLLFGRDPQRWVPQADLIAARFSGPTVTDAFVRQVIRGTLLQQLRAVEVFLRDHLRETVALDGMRSRRRLEYPLEAVRELVVNAVAHRDYSIAGDGIRLFLFSDRLEVHSPGRLAGPVTLDNLLEARFSRNPVIVQVLADLGYIERLGYGIDRVVALAREWQLRRPLFEETAGGFRASLFAAVPESALTARQRWQGMDLNPRQWQALEFLTRNGRITNREVLEIAPGVTAETIRRDLADLVGRGLLLKIGDRRGTYYILKQIESTNANAG
jgi:ATP-dependent DNA helicase RecG